MIKEDVLKFIALFCIELIVFLPFYVADVYASADLKNVEVYGSDNIKGFLREKDSITIKADAKIDGEVTPEQVLLIINTRDDGKSNVSFGYLGGSCNQKILEPDYYKCIAEAKDVSDIDKITRLQVSLYNETTEQLIGPTEEARFDVDNKNPVIKDFYIYRADGDVIAHYEVSDAGAGLAAVKFYVDNLRVFTKELAGEASYMDEQVLEDVEHGEHNFYIKVYDRLGNYAISSTGTRDVDYKTPLVDSLSITDANGVPLEYLRPVLYFGAKVVLRLEEENEVETAYADYSE